VNLWGKRYTVAMLSKLLLVVILLSAPLAHAAPKPLPPCSLFSLGSPARGPVRCFLAQMGEVIELEEGELLIGYVFEEADFLKQNYKVFVDEVKKILARKFGEIEEPEKHTRGGVRLKVTFVEGLGKPYIGTVVSKVVKKGEPTEKTTMTFAYERKLDHPPTDAEKKDVAIAGKQKLDEFIRWTGRKPETFTAVSEPVVTGLNPMHEWSVAVTIKTKP